MRQSCDRCHKQKLRCTRAGNNSNTGACDRCFRKHAQCVFSSSLPKGRPSMYSYGSADDSTGPKNADLTDPHPPVPVDDSSPVSALIEDTSLDLPTDLWPWTQPFNWDDTSMEWSDQGSGQLILNQHAMIDTAQTDDKMACITAVPNLLDRTAAVQDGDRDDYAQRQPGPTTPTQSLSQFFGHGHGHSHGTGHIGGSSGTSFGGGSDNNDGLDVVIAELAHLSVHLSPLRRSSYSLAGTLESSYHQNQARQKPLIDDATFESVAGWLAHGHGSAHNTTNMSSSPAANGHNPPFSPLPAPETKTTSAMLYHTFSASRHLLEILRYLQPNGGVSGTSTLSKPTRSTTPSTSASSSDALYFKLPKSSACNNIIHHQVIACHMILLNIYVAVLAVLERDTDPRAHRDNAAPLGDIR